MQGRIDYHPWRELRGMPHVVLDVVGDLPADVRALTDGQRRVWLRAGMSQVQRRCTIAHELTHLRRGHRGCQPPAVEASVRRETARCLVPDVHRLGEELAWAHDLGEAADALWVTREVLADRLGSLHPAERAILQRRLEEDPRWC